MESQNIREGMERIRQSYLTLFGYVPSSIEHRFVITQQMNRSSTFEVVETLRQHFIMKNPLGLKTQQLVHFGQLLALGYREQATAHAGAAIRAGATQEELLGVAETAFITAGMPAYNLGITVLAQLALSSEKVCGDRDGKLGMGEV